MRLGQELRRLGRHSAIYGLGGLVSRILATLLLPLYTHYLPPGSYGRVEIVTAATAVLAIALQMGISSAFFRFYFDAKEDAERLTVIRTSFWFTMAMSTVGLVLGIVFAAPIAHLIGLGHDPALVRAGAVGLWAQTNYQQLTALFRVEERSAQYAVASIANVLITVAAMVRVRRGLPLGRDRPRRRQLHGHAGRVHGAARVPQRAARARVRPRPAPEDAALRHAARPVGARAVDDQLRRPGVRRALQDARPRSACTPPP